MRKLLARELTGGLRPVHIALRIYSTQLTCVAIVAQTSVKQAGRCTRNHVRTAAGQSGIRLLRAATAACTSVQAHLCVLSLPSSMSNLRPDLPHPPAGQRCQAATQLSFKVNPHPVLPRLLAGQRRQAATQLSFEVNLRPDQSRLPGGQRRQAATQLSFEVNLRPDQSRLPGGQRRQAATQLS